MILIAGHPVQICAAPDGLTFNAGSVTTRKLSWVYMSYGPLCKWNGITSPKPHGPHDETNQSLRNAPMLHIHRGVLSESTYQDEDPERATQPEAVSVVRRRTVPWTYCRSTNTRDLTKSKSYVIDESFPSGYDSTPHPEMAL